MTREPFNVAVHDQLTVLGYELTQHREDYWDDGDAESGPSLNGGPAYDEYCGPDEYICIDEQGHVVHRDDRNLELEQWLDDQDLAATTNKEFKL
jgi:hypothetical protein